MSHSSAVKTAWGLFVFLAIVLPLGVFGGWGGFEKEKTIPQWLAERGYSVTQIAVPYLICAAVVSIAFYLILVAYSKGREKPNLAGEIICLDTDPRPDRKGNDYDCFITLQIKVRNRGTPTAVDTFSLDLWWEGVDHPGTTEPLDGYVVETLGREPGDLQSIHATRTSPLWEFPVGQEITTTSKSGWRRFSFGSLPPEMIEGDDLAKDVVIELKALDSQETRHTIHKGKMYDGVQRLIGGCGKIWKPPF
jgi:hypothetical protein